jgi:hypothetical protein
MKNNEDYKEVGLFSSNFLVWFSAFYLLFALTIIGGYIILY